MGRIGLDTFKQTVSGVNDDAEVRLGSKDRQPKTAERDFAGRAVRWMFGATKQDRVDNKKLMVDLRKGLEAKYGVEVAARAFLAARPEAYVAKGGDIMADTMKPLTARQVRTAIAEAKASPLRYAPGGDKFGQVTARANMGADQLSPEQEQYFKSRLREHVGLQAQKGAPLSGDEIEKYASKLLKHTVNNVGDQATVRQEAYNDAKKTALQTVRALSGGGSESAPDLLLKLARSCEKVVSDSTLDEGDVGGQDIENARQRVINSAVSRLTPQMAKQLYDRAMSSNGTGRQLLLATRLAEDQVGGTNAYAIGGHGDLTGTLSTLIQQLGARAGIPPERTDATIQTIDNVRTSGKGQHRVPADALRDAGVSDARKVGSLLTGVLNAAGERAKDYAQRDQDELLEVEQIHQAEVL